MNQKAQISQTMNWVVATIVIIVILTISFFIASSDVLNGNGWTLNDKEKDFVATTSIVNFVENNYDLIETSVISEDYELLEKTTDDFLENIELSDKWNIELFVDEEPKPKFKSGPFGTVGKYTYKKMYFIFDMYSKKVKLTAWIEDESGYETDSDYTGIF